MSLSQSVRSFSELRLMLRLIDRYSIDPDLDSHFAWNINPELHQRLDFRRRLLPSCLDRCEKFGMIASDEGPFVIRVDDLAGTDGIVKLIIEIVAELLTGEPAFGHSFEHDPRSDDRIERALCVP